MPIDYSEYPDNWFTKIRPAVLERANNCCEGEGCGIANYAVIKREKNGGYRYPCQTDWDMIHSRIKNCHSNMTESLKYHGFTKIILTIAHLDHDKLNHDVDLTRLKALCQRCHLKYDIMHHVENRKYGRKYRENNYKLDL